MHNECVGQGWTRWPSKPVALICLAKETQVGLCGMSDSLDKRTNIENWEEDTSPREAEAFPQKPHSQVKLNTLKMKSSLLSYQLPKEPTTGPILCPYLGKGHHHSTCHRSQRQTPMRYLWQQTLSSSSLSILLPMHFSSAHSCINTSNLLTKTPHCLDNWNCPFLVSQLCPSNGSPPNHASSSSEPCNGFLEL